MNAISAPFPPATAVETSAAHVGMESAGGRLSLRARGDLGPLGAALGVALPTRIGETAGTDIRLACLGPDDWIITAPAGEVARLQSACAAIYADHPHSLVDISGREVSFAVAGPRAAELLTLGCPRDIDSIAIGEARRTVMDGVTVVLWRDGENSFRIDVWNSFAPWLLHLLETGCRELAAEALATR